MPFSKVINCIIQLPKECNRINQDRTIKNNTKYNLNRRVSNVGKLVKSRCQLMLKYAANPDLQSGLHGVAYATPFCY
jgi:hypothetical protein